MPPIARTISFRIAIVLFVLGLFAHVNDKNGAIAAGCLIAGGLALVAAAIETRGSGPRV